MSIFKPHKEQGSLGRGGGMEHFVMMEVIDLKPLWHKSSESKVCISPYFSLQHSRGRHLAAFLPSLEYPLQECR